MASGPAEDILRAHAEEKLSGRVVTPDLGDPLAGPPSASSLQHSDKRAGALSGVPWPSSLPIRARIGGPPKRIHTAVASSLTLRLMKSFLPAQSLLGFRPDAGVPIVKKMTGVPFNTGQCESVLYR